MRRFYYLISLISVFICFEPCLSAQTRSKKVSKDERLLVELYEKADSSGSAGNIQEALDIIHYAYKAVRKPQRFRWPYYELRSLEALALMSLEQPDYENAIKALKDVEIGLPEMSSYVYPELGRAYLLNGQYDDAIHYLDLSLQTEEKKDSVDVYWLLRSKEMLATAYKGKGDIDTASDVLCSFFDEQLSVINHEEYVQLLVRAYYDLVVSDGNIVSYDKGALRILQELANDSQDKDAAWYVYFKGQIAQVAQVLGNFQLAYDSSIDAINHYSPDCNRPIHSFYTSAAAAASRLGRFQEAHHLLDLAEEQISQEEDPYLKDYFEKEILNDRSIFYLDEGINTEIAIKNLEFLLKDDSLSPDMRAGYLYNLGQAYDDSDLQKAEEVYTEALKYYEESEGHGILYAKTLNQLGLLSLKNGFHDNAMKYFELAIDIFRRRSDENNYSFALALGNAAQCALRINQFGRTIAWGEESCRIQAESVGYMYPQVWDVLLSAYSNLGNWNDYERVYAEYSTISQSDIYESVRYQIKEIERCYSRGEVEKAISYIPRLDSLYLDLPEAYREQYDYSITRLKERLFPGDNSVFLYYADGIKDIDTLDRHSKQFLRSLGFECRGREDYVSANTFFKLAYEPGMADYDYLNSSLDAAAVCDDEDFCNLLKEDIVVFVNSQYKNVIGLTESEKEYYWRDIRDLQNMLFYYRKNTYSDKLLFNLLLKTKNFLLRSNIALQDYLIKSGNTTLVNKCEELKRTRRAIGEGRSNLTPEVLDSLRLREIAINREIVNNMKDLSGFDIYGDLSFDNVRDALKKNEVAIEFIDYPTQEGSIRYGAFIVTKDEADPIFVPLCTEDELMNMLVIDPHKLYDKDLPFSHQLYDLIWRPLIQFIPKGGHIFISPSGELNIIALEAIAVDESSYLRDIVSVSRLTSTAELCVESASASLVTASVFGGIKYSETKTQEDSDAPVYSETGYLLDRGTTDKITYLPGTKAEAETINKILSTGNLETTLYIGAKGTEEAFKSLSGRGISLIHIATHGFYQPRDKVHKIGFYGDPSSSNPISSMQRSGLLLAGCEPAWNGNVQFNREDGVLTASEIAELDFSETELVVMSACESGLGEITDDGVAGLQRSFKNAGVKSLVMSLWKVDDKATEMLMTSFYKNLSKGISPSIAFRDAQDALKRQNKYENPYYWASFILLD